MSILRRLERRAYEGGAFFPSDQIPPPGMTLPALTGYGTSSDNAMRHAAVYACVRLIADAVASFPVDAFVGDVGMHLGEAERVTPKPPVLVKPSDYLSGVQWVHQVMMSLLLQGNAYGLITNTDRVGYPTQIDLLDPQAVTVRRSTGNDVNTVTTTLIAAGRKVFKIGTSTLTEREVWHCPGPMMPGELSGLSPVKYAARTIGMGVAAEEFGANYFRNGIHPTAVATTEQEVSEDDAKTIKTRIRAAVAGRDTPVLGKGVKLTPWGVNPQDSQLLEVQRYNEVMVCQIFGVPPEMIGASSEGSSITYANREQRAMDFLNNSINPWLTRLEDSFTALFPRTTFVKFDTKGLLKSDLKTRYEAWKIGIDGGFLRPEDARQFEDLPPMPQQVAPPDAPDADAPDEGLTA